MGSVGMCIASSSPSSSSRFAAVTGTWCADRDNDRRDLPPGHRRRARRPGRRRARARRPYLGRRRHRRSQLRADPRPRLTRHATCLLPLAFLIRGARSHRARRWSQSTCTPNHDARTKGLVAYGPQYMVPSRWPFGLGAHKPRREGHASSANVRPRLRLIIEATMNL